MNVDTLKLVYFSPTGTTARVLRAIAQGFGAISIEQVDLTLPATNPLKSDHLKSDPFKLGANQDELVVIGVPVYEGRVAGAAIPRLRQFTAHKTPAVIVVVYGNRDFEDALIELSDLAGELGFLPVAGGAFIGEHSFANENRPMATGRPDERDLLAAREFGSKIRARLKALGSMDAASTITPPGNRPYIDRDRSALADKCASTIDQTCILCGECALICPVGAITIEDAVKTDSQACVLCNACVKNCSAGARVVADPMVNKIANWVSKNYQVRKEPEIFI